MWETVLSDWTMSDSTGIFFNLLEISFIFHPEDG